MDEISTSLKFSNENDKIIPALIKVQEQMRAIPFDKVNPHFKAKYASLSATQEIARPILAQNKLGIIQSLYSIGPDYFLESRILHESTQWVSSTLKLLGCTNMQMLGAATTYAKRYTVQALLGVSGDDDDDGNAVSQKVETNQRQSSPAAASRGHNHQDQKKTYPKVDPPEFRLNLGDIKGVKLGEIDHGKLVKVGSWLSNAIKNDTEKQNKSYKYWCVAYANVKKVLETYETKPAVDEPPAFEEDDPGPPPEWYQEQEPENPFEQFQDEQDQKKK